jgi:hypothetical protein
LKPKPQLPPASRTSPPISGGKPLVKSTVLRTASKPAPTETRG